MPEISDVVAGETILVSWGNPIRDRTVQRYADVTQRDSLNPSPSIGDVAYITSDQALYIWQGNFWELYATQPFVAGTYVPKSGGQFTGPLTVSGKGLFDSNPGPQIEVAPPAGINASVRFSGDDSTQIDIGAAAGGPTYPNDYFTIGTQLNGVELRVASFAFSFLEFNRSNGHMTALTNLRFGSQFSIVNPTSINAYVNGSWSIRMRDTGDGGDSGLRGYAITKADGGTRFEIYDYNTNGARFILDSGTERVRSIWIYAGTSAGAANVYVDSSGNLVRSTSSIKDKRNRKALTLKRAAAIVGGLEPITFQSKIETDGDREWLGFGLEPTVELDEALDGGGAPDMRAIAAALVRVMQDYGKRLERLEAR